MSGSRGGAFAARAAIAVLLATSLLPIANWIASERSAPWYGGALRAWLVGTLVVATAGIALAALSFRLPGLWRRGSLREGLALLDPADGRALLLVSVAAGAVYAAVAVLVFDARPVLIDELILTVQARTYASGRLWLPADPDPAFRSALNLVEYGGRAFGHFPPGWPAFMALAEWFGAGWLAGPVAGALTVAAFGLVLRRVESAPSVRAGGLLLFALAPYPLVMAASRMSHGPALGLGLFALAGWLRLRERPSRWVAAGTGLALGLLAATRPAEAVAFALPVGGWAAWRLLRDRRAPELALLVLAAGVPVVLMLLVNSATTGSPFVSGYSLLWGDNVGLGFHPAPYGPDHTPLRGAELIGLYLLRLNQYLFEAPIPGLLAAGAALLLSRRWDPGDRCLLAVAAVTLLLYFAYWHDGFFLGPRFVYPLAPVVALWTVRLPGQIAARFGEGLPYRSTVWGLAAAMGLALATGIPARIGANAGVQPTFRFDADRAAAEAGIRDALILVRESWGAQLLARLWALGLSRPAAERYYRNIDSCLLDGALTRLEEAGAPAPATVLDPLTADSARLLASPFSPDTSERVLDGARYDRRCLARIAEDRAGFTLFAPVLLSTREDLRFVRDLHQRNAAELSRYPGRPVYLLTRGPDDRAPSFHPVDRDSMLAAP